MFSLRIIDTHAFLELVLQSAVVKDLSFPPCSSIMAFTG